MFVWVNDEKNKRAYGSKTDAYRVFEKMLNSGHPPDGWNQLCNVLGWRVTPHAITMLGSTLAP